MLPAPNGPTEQHGGGEHSAEVVEGAAEAEGALNFVVAGISTVLALAGLALLFARLRRREPTQDLTGDEESRLAALLDDETA